MSPNKPKVSIILPIYNAGEHLKKCLDTLINQSLKEIEIIVILDCPTDGSNNIVDLYAKNDNRIKIIRNEKNLHIGFSRNEGLKIASGEYIGFSDHDDYRELTMYEELYNEAKNNSFAEIVISPIVNVRDKEIEHIEIPDIPQKHVREYVLSDLLGRGNYRRDVSLFCNIHNMIYKTDLIIKHNIKFVDTRIVTPEDVLFNIECFYHSSKVILMNKLFFYYHVMLQESAGHDYSYSNWRKRGEGMLYIYKFLNENNCYELYEINFHLQATKQLLNSLLETIVKMHSIKEFLVAYKKIKEYPFTKEAFKHYYMAHKSTSFLKRTLRNVLAKKLSN